MHKDARLEYKLWGMLVFATAMGSATPRLGTATTPKPQRRKSTNTEQVLHRLVHGVNHFGVGSSHLGLGAEPLLPDREVRCSPCRRFLRRLPACTDVDGRECQKLGCTPRSKTVHC